MEHLTRNKNDMMKDVVINYRGCGHKEYYGMLVWRDGLQYCRRCIHKIWVEENPDGWKPSLNEKYFPLYSDGINYYEKDVELANYTEKLKEQYLDIYEKYCELHPEEITSDFILEEDGKEEYIKEIIEMLKETKWKE